MIANRLAAIAVRSRASPGRAAIVPRGTSLQLEIKTYRLRRNTRAGNAIAGAAEFFEDGGFALEAVFS